MENQQIPSLSIILLSEEIEKIHAGSLVGSVAAMSGMKVNVFVTMNALKSFLKENVDTQNFASGTVGNALVSKQAPLFDTLLREGKENGDLNIYACALAMDVMEWKKEDLINVFDDVIGVTAFLGMSMGAQVVTM